MKRGDIVTVAMQGEFGKPRPAVIVQSDLFSETATVTVLPVTSFLAPAPRCRIDVNPSATNGLRAASQIMVDKAVIIGRSKIGSVIGSLERVTMTEVQRALAVFLGLAG